ncbi:MAG: hypothetical protein WBC04_06550 [Candidatus Acidiferrales bacterium]
MAVPSSLDDIKPSRALGIVGVANVMIAGVGLAQLFIAYCLLHSLTSMHLSRDIGSRRRRSQLHFFSYC